MSRAVNGAAGGALPVAYADVADAARRLEGQAHRTPVVTSRTVDARTGAAVFFKCENLQRGGAFKFRGAYNALSHLAPEQKRSGVVAYSSGNHAQAVALAGQLLQVPAVIALVQDRHDSARKQSRYNRRRRAHFGAGGRYLPADHALRRRHADRRRRGAFAHGALPVGAVEARRRADRRASSAAALLEGKLDARGCRVGVVLSGGNADIKQLCQLF